MALAAGFLGGLSLGLIVALWLCVWWVKKMHHSVFEDPAVDAETSQDSHESSSMTEEESTDGEWWKR